MRPLAIGAIVLGCVIFFGIIIGVFVRLRNRRRALNRAPIFSIPNPNVLTPIYTAPHTGGNGTGVSGIRASYGTSTTRLHGAGEEEPSSSYNSITSPLPAQQ